MREFCKKVVLYTTEEYLKKNQNKKLRKFESVWEHTLDGHLRKYIDNNIKKI